MSKVTVNAVTLDMLIKDGKYELEVTSKASVKIGELDTKKVRDKQKDEEDIAKDINVVDGDSKITVSIDDKQKLKEDDEKETQEIEKEEKEEETKKEKSIDDILNSGDDMLI